jgi:hypothetical protein
VRAGAMKKPLAYSVIILAAVVIVGLLFGEEVSSEIAGSIGAVIAVFGICYLVVMGHRRK